MVWFCLSDLYFTILGEGQKALLPLGPIYTWRTLTGVKLYNNQTKYLVQKFFWQCNQDTEPELH